MNRTDADNDTLLLKAPLNMWVYLCLTVITLALYWPVRNYDFIAFDDDVYVTDNKLIKSGFSREGFKWAFKLKEERFQSYWQPLTWLSHMLDVQVYGLNSGNHHLTNLIFHILNTLLLFRIFYLTTGKPWPSAFVAALFAIHPLNVESVAWVAARKNVLSTFFWFTTLSAYIGYARKPNISGYLFAFLLFILGLMAKPMLVTLPFVLLLFDFWPLGRLKVQYRPKFSKTRYEGRGSDDKSENVRPVIRLFMEKVPFLLGSAFSVYVSTALVQRYSSVTLNNLAPVSLRIANALTSYVKYILKMILPLNLAFLYPFPDVIPGWQTAGAAVFMVAVSWLALHMITSRPYFAFGWMWYVGTLLPVIGLIQAGSWPEMADRWGYVPLIGLFIILAWGIPDILERWRYKKNILVSLTITLLLTLLFLTHTQIQYWRDSLTLFDHALKTTSGNIIVHNNLGVVLEKRGRIDEAITHYEKALKIHPGYVDAHMNLGSALYSLGQYPEAMEHFQEAVKFNPDSASAHFNLGNVLSARKKFDGAIRYYKAALRLDPLYVEAHNNLGAVLMQQGRTIEARAHFQEALRIRPDYAGAYRNFQKSVSMDHPN